MEVETCFDLPDFDLDILFNMISSNGIWDPAVSVFGVRRSGKTELVKYILNEANDRRLIGRVGVITSTNFRSTWNEMIPSMTIFELDDVVNVIESLFESQKNIIENVENGNTYKYGSSQYTIILDDFIHEKKFSVFSSTILKLYTTGRHYDISVWLLSQHPAGVSNIVRNNSDFAIILRMTSFQSKKTIYQDHLDFIDNVMTCIHFIDHNTKDYRAIIILKTDPHLQPEERVYTMIADINTEKKMIGNDLWVRDMNNKQKSIMNLKKRLGHTLDKEIDNMIDIITDLSFIRV